MILGANGQRSGAQGHHFKLLAPLHICGTDSASKVQIVYIIALRGVIACGSKRVSECAGVVEHNSL